MIDTDMIMLDDIQSTLKLSQRARVLACNSENTYLGKLSPMAVNNFYNHADEKYELIYNIVKLIQQERTSHAAVEKFKWSNGLRYDDLKKFYLQFLSKDIMGKLLSDDEIKNADIETNNINLIKNENMNDDEILNKINHAMLNQSIKYMEQNHPEYDLHDEEDIKALYYELYSIVCSEFLQLSVDMEELQRINELIDLHNIVEEKNNKEEKNT